MMYHWCCSPLPLLRSCQVKFQDHNKQECERGVVDFHQQSRITWKGSLNEGLFTSCWLLGMSMRDSPGYIYWDRKVYPPSWVAPLPMQEIPNSVRVEKMKWHKHVIVNITRSFLPSSCHSGFPAMADNCELQWAISPISWFCGIFSHSTRNETYFE